MVLHLCASDHSVSKYLVHVHVVVLGDYFVIKTNMYVLIGYATEFRYLPH